MSGTRAHPRSVRTLLGAATLVFVVSALGAPHPLQQARRAMGLKVATKKQLDQVPMSYAPFSTTAVKGAVDLSGSLGPVGDQGGQSSCTAWAAAYSLKTLHERVERKWSVSDAKGQPVADHVFSPAYLYNLANGGRDGGIYFVDALDRLVAEGVSSLQAMPYDESDFKSQPSAQAKTEAAHFKILDYLRADHADASGLKEYLSAGFPVLVGVNTDKAFHSAEGEGWTWTSIDGPNFGPHALLIVGYDDARGAFRLVNSWGPKWGDRGYCWVTYGLLPQVATEAWVTRDVQGSGGVGVRSTPNPGREEVSVLGAKPGVIDPDTNEKGIEIRGRVRLRQDLGTRWRVVVYFNRTSGSTDTQEPMRGGEEAYKDGKGQLAAFMPEAPIEGKADLGSTEWRIFIPERAIGEKEAVDNDALRDQKVTVVPVLFVDRLGVARGKPMEVVAVGGDKK